MFALDQGRYTVAAGATGLIRACRDASVNYAKQRKTFGVEIGSHQLVKEMIAQMESDYQASRLLWLRAGWLKNEGRRNTRETGLAKWFSTVASERAAGDAVQIHGANGYSDEYPVGPVLSQLQGRGDLRGHARDSQDHAGRLPARLPNGQTDALRAASVGDTMTTDDFDNRRPWMRRPQFDSDLSLDFLRVVEQAAIACAHTMGQGDRHKSDQVAVEAMRQEMDSVPIDGTIVIGEGERDEAPMLYIGEKVGMARTATAAPYPQVDIAVDPLEGTNLCATGAPNALAVLAASESGGLLHAPDIYMEKLVVGPSSRDVVDLDAPVRFNLRAIAQASAAGSRTWWSSCSIGRATRS